MSLKHEREPIVHLGGEVCPRHQMSPAVSICSRTITDPTACLRAFGKNVPTVLNSSASSVEPGGHWAALPQPGDLTSSGQDLCGTGTPAAGYLATVTNNISLVQRCTCT